MSRLSCKDASAAKKPAIGGTTIRLQRKPACSSVHERNGAGFDRIPDSVQRTLATEGHPLDASTRVFMQPRFGQDFSQVRVHTDAQAAQSAEAVNALAYTAGNHVVFAPRQYAPESAAGQRLLAHELTHVVQQQQATTVAPDTLNQRDDVHEAAANTAAESVLLGRRLSSIAPSATPAVQRQFAGQGLGQGVTNVQSQGETVLESFLNRMWEAQSKQKKPFRVTPLVRQGLGYVFLFVPSLPITDYASPAEVMGHLRGSIPSTVSGNTIRALDTLPALEKPLAGKGSEKGDAEPAKPDFGSSKLPAGVGGPPKLPEAPKGYDDAAAKAAEAAFDEFRKTKIGKELEKFGKDYVLSLKGLPFDLWVVGTVATIIAANDPKLPGIPEIPVAEGIKIKINYSGRVSDLPPLLRQMVEGHAQASQAGQGETKIGVSVTFTFEALGEFASAVGRFFAKAAKWFANGVIKIGTVIGKALSSIKREIFATLGGAALGAGIGALAGGGIGALIGAGIGAAVGLAGALISHLFDRKKNP